MSGTILYTQSLGSYAENVEVPHIDVRDPTANDTNYPVGKRWINTSSNIVFSLGSFSFSQLDKTANWINLTGISIDACGSVTLVGGKALVQTPACNPNSLVFYTYTAFQGTLGQISVDPANIGEGEFIIGSSQPGDASTVFYFVVNP